MRHHSFLQIYKFNHFKSNHLIINITTNPQFKKSRIEVEKKAVKEELTRELNDPGWKIADKIYNIYYNHPGLKNGNNIPLYACKEEE